MLIFVDFEIKDVLLEFWQDGLKNWLSYIHALGRKTNKNWRGEASLRHLLFYSFIFQLQHRVEELPECNSIFDNGVGVLSFLLDNNMAGVVDLLNVCQLDELKSNEDGDHDNNIITYLLEFNHLYLPAGVLYLSTTVLSTSLPVIFIYFS